MLQILGPIYIEGLILMMLLWPVAYLLALPVSALQKHWNPGSITLLEIVCSWKYLLLFPAQFFWWVIILYLISSLSS